MPFDDEDYGEPKDIPAEAPSLGTCCICGCDQNVTTIVTLPVKASVPGHGWGCFVCGLPADGASAVLCAACTPAWQAGEPIRFACRGYPAEDGRVSIEALTEPHEHDPDQHPDDAPRTVIR